MITKTLYHKIHFVLFIGVISFFGCGGEQKKDQSTARNFNGLKDYYRDYFSMGVSVSSESLTDSSYSDLIKNEFVSMTAENVMKPGPIHPKEDQYNWESADVAAAFAKENGLMLRGHTLCWHNQTADWFFEDENGDQIGKEDLLLRLEEHIKAVAGRYRGQIYAWDVVNEAISDSEDEYYRKSPWYQICGEDYIIKAFQYAKRYAPDAVLFYNDYNVIDPIKRQKIIKMIAELRDKGAPIEGIGIQGHWSVYEPSEEQLRATIEELKPLGLELQITELDISIYEKGEPRRDRNETDDDTFTPELELMQSKKYKMIFDLFREYKDDITNVTFWNISDRRSWLDHFPVRGRKDYPLLFDQEDKRKKVYQEVIDF